ncbi:MAG TPA: LysM peptidoglycan-binding domain-containing protein, partial [Thermoanaerobaculia bacterium]|nr:LysM peptidoglycan-binding domain-containing protein [Thermoanaerobaculia bacterium]
HPTGMAADLRISNRPACRAWIEKTLLVLEDEGVVEATRERHPPHYHVTLFPKPYMRYVAGRGGSGSADVQMAKVTATASRSGVAVASSKRYKVGRGDSLWSIAQRHRTSVTSLKRANGIRSSRLKPGQMLAIPTR